jgi:hypothetical protein
MHRQNDKRPKLETNKREKNVRRPGLGSFDFEIRIVTRKSLHFPLLDTSEIVQWVASHKTNSNLASKRITRLLSV